MMCAYCNYSVDNDIYPKALISEDIVTIKEVSALEIFVDFEDHHEWRLELYQNTDNDFFDLAGVPINYCPICGRKLRKG